MTFPQKNASTIFAMPDMGPPNQDTLVVNAQGNRTEALPDDRERVRALWVGDSLGRGFAFPCAMR